MRSLDVIDRELEPWEQRAEQTRRDGLASRAYLTSRSYSSRMAAIYDRLAVLWAERARVLERADAAAAARAVTRHRGGT